MKITTKTIRDLNPCARGLDNFLKHYKDFDGTHEDFLSLEYVNHAHKLWVLLRLMPRFEVEVFAIDCAIAANAAYAANAADAAYAAYAATYAADAADAASAAYTANAASYATSATSAADAAYAHYAIGAASYAATCAAYYATDAASAAGATEKERQLAAINYLINKSEELNERI